MGVVLANAGSAGKIYLSGDICCSIIPNLNLLEERIQSICAEEGLTLPNEHINNLETRWFSPPDYGFPRFADIFTPRQLLALLTFTTEVHHAYEAMLEARIDPEQA